jgi:hypothetical protein
LSKAPVDVLTVADSDDQDEQPVVLNVINDPIVAYTDPVELFGRLKLRGVTWARNLFQRLDPRKNPLLRAAIELSELTGCGG